MIQIKYKSLVEMGANNSTPVTPVTPGAPPPTPVTRGTSPSANGNVRANQAAARAMAAASANERRNMASDEQWEAFIAAHRDLEEGIRRIKYAIEQDDAHSYTRGTSPNEAVKKAFYNASEPIQREMVDAFMAVYTHEQLTKDPATKSAFIALVPDWVPKLAKIYGKNLSGGKRKSKQRKQSQRTRSKNRK
jgi:hypothetical protein